MTGLCQKGMAFGVYRIPYAGYGQPATIPAMHDPIEFPLPVVGEITEATWDQVAEGQPVLLLRNGRPAAVIVDLESWAEAEACAEAEPAPQPA